MKFSKIVALSSVLVKSQLRAGRSGRLGEKFFRNPAALFKIDAVAFLGCAVLGEIISTFVGFSSTSVGASVGKILGQTLIFLPALVPGVVVMAGIFFELGTSSRFASSDSVNWLPLTQAEYVTASILSVSYNYSVILSIVLGLTSTMSIHYSLLAVWFVALLFSVVSLFLGGTLVEILRAALNKVSSVVYSRAKRGALILRLVAAVVVILVFQLIFNVVFLIEIISSFFGILTFTPFIPLFWPSLAVKALLDADAIGFVLFTAGSLAFVAAMAILAIRVRTNYWSPIQVQLSVVASESKHRTVWLERLGFTAVEATLIRKDLRGFARRRELLQYLAIPPVLAIVLFLQVLVTGSKSEPAHFSTMPMWFVGGFLALIISSISIGQEGKAVLNLYSLPVSTAEIFRAKIFSSLLFSMVTTVILAVVVQTLTGASEAILQVIPLAVLIVFEETFVGIGFSSRFSDFQDRPRPRFLDPVGIILTSLVGLATIFVTALPVAVEEVMAPTQLEPLALAKLTAGSGIIGITITVAAYKWAKSGVNSLFREFIDNV